ncbi:MAG: MotA/TolQ/ExbB proton channel family protein [Cyclobacteriaceae bacterium]
MIELFNEGGPLFMGILTILFLLMIVAAVRTYTRYSQSKTNLKQAKQGIANVRSLGLLALVFGIFGQLLGLYQMFVAIQEIESVAPALLAGGLKVSMITTLYGMFIFIIGIIAVMILRRSIRKVSK